MALQWQWLKQRLPFFSFGSLDLEIEAYVELDFEFFEKQFLQLEFG